MEILSSRILLHPSDLERSLRFYEQTLGLAVYREWGSGSNRGVVFFLGGGLLEVSGTTVDPPSDAARLLLQVRDLRAAWRRLTEEGVVIEKHLTHAWSILARSPSTADRDVDPRIYPVAPALDAVAAVQPEHRREAGSSDRPDAVQATPEQPRQTYREEMHGP